MLLYYLALSFKKGKKNNTLLDTTKILMKISTHILGLFLKIFKTRTFHAYNMLNSIETYTICYMHKMRILKMFRKIRSPEMCVEIFLKTFKISKSVLLSLLKTECKYHSNIAT